ncbi:MAG TPA: PIN domain-containing protein [Longimicrobium sp.]|nr:PIN domain-containing protein [Longimicrobium sp.]
MATAVVVDTNILFSALLKEDSRFLEVLLDSQYEFYASELLVTELFAHKERIVRASRLPEPRIVKVLHTLLEQITIYREQQVPREHKREALRLCVDVDPADTPHVARALALNAPLWTGDRKLRRGLEAKGFTHFFDPGDV